MKQSQLVNKGAVRTKPTLFYFCLGFLCLLVPCFSAAHYAPVVDLSSSHAFQMGPAKTRPIKTSKSSLKTRLVQLKSLRFPKIKSPVLVSRWAWPTQGKVLRLFSAANKGIDIGGRRGEPICAVAAGTVVYNGKAKQGLGNLLIIAHDHRYSSSYAHFQNAQVKKGDWVNKGQKIAEMSNKGTNKIMLHFEILKASKAIDPLIVYQGG